MFIITRDRVGSASRAVGIDGTLDLLEACLLITIETTCACHHSRTSERTEETNLTIDRFTGSFRAVFTERASLTCILLKSTESSLIGTCWTWTRLNCAQGTVVTFRTLICADIGQSGLVAIETFVAVETISLIDFLCPRIVSAEITGILLLLVHDVISLRWAIVTWRALNRGA
jgi:hypothetical protein